ncbi:MAG: hypothetical protein OXG08_08420 [Gammaproteobacteria bacterium]|nr:hypothetical protein [Gammaproteobacteria bacterium]
MTIASEFMENLRFQATNAGPLVDIFRFVPKPEDQFVRLVVVYLVHDRHGNPLPDVSVSVIPSESEFSDLFAQLPLAEGLEEYIVRVVRSLRYLES